MRGRKLLSCRNIFHGYRWRTAQHRCHSLQRNRNCIRLLIAVIEYSQIEALLCRPHKTLPLRGCRYRLRPDERPCPLTQQPEDFGRHKPPWRIHAPCGSSARRLLSRIMPPLSTADNKRLRPSVMLRAPSSAFVPNTTWSGSAMYKFPAVHPSVCQRVQHVLRSIDIRR